jgi:hypothetical protein
LQVPDGTTAMVRCPACKTVFSAADSPPPEPEPEPEPEKPRVRVVVRKSAPEEEKPKPKAKSKTEEKAKAENRDFDPVSEEEDRKRKKKRKRDDDEATAEEKKERKRAFQRAAIGVKLIWISLVVFMLSMLLILVFFFQAAFVAPDPIFLTAAGVLGIVNWLLAAVGVGMCLSGPRAPGHWEYGIAAAVAVVVHLIFVFALAASGKEASVGKTADEVHGDMGNAKWGVVPTRLDATMFYLTAILYRDNQGATPKGPMLASMICGVIEMTRTVLIMMLLSCLARAALDEGLAHKCTRAAGVASGGPALIALLMFVFVAILIETNAGLNMFTMILFVTVNMGAYSIIVGTIFPAFMAAREVNDACDEPFQSLIPQL